ncbi:MAG: Gfo/Idh/MocA family oxidoreductase, partial [Oscillospiraceae bacterium]
MRDDSALYRADRLTPRTALIGCGRIAGNHLAAARANGLFIAALCDLDARRAHEKAPENAAVYTDYRRMLDEIRPELVVIATDSGSHAAIALDCLAAGCHVLIEKPVALSLSSADALCAAAERHGRIAAVCHQNRFNAPVRALRAALDDGALGRLCHGAAQVRWRRDDAYYAQAAWRGRWESDGGTLMNQCIHGIDLLRWMLGDEVEEVYGATRQQFHDYLEAEDIGMAVVKFKNGAIGTIEGT